MSILIKVSRKKAKLKILNSLTESKFDLVISTKKISPSTVPKTTLDPNLAPGTLTRLLTSLSVNNTKQMASSNFTTNASTQGEKVVLLALLSG